eukprot:7230469-Heterocapsa_arctica.AAC.1
MGKRFESDEHYSTPQGVRKCRAIAPMPAADRWDKKAIEQLMGVPWALDGEAREIAADVVFRDHPADRTPD